MKNNMPKVSVIILVYNVEKYLQQCIDSLFAQTLKDIEYIFVNDASADHSLEILKRNVCMNPSRMKIRVLYESIGNRGGRYLYSVYSR